MKILALAVTALLPASVALAQGANDCAAAQPVKGFGTFPFTNVGATTDGAADALCNFFGNSNIYNDVWFRFTAPETTDVDIGNCGLATFDTKIAVYCGDCLALVCVGGNDDDCAGGGQVVVVDGIAYIAHMKAPHGTTIVAVSHTGGVVMAGDRRATAGLTIASRRMEKVFPADDFSGVAIAGAAGLALAGSASAFGATTGSGARLPPPSSSSSRTAL